MYLFVSEITTDYESNYKLVTKKGRLPVVTVSFYADSGKRLALWYFSTANTSQDIVVYAWGLLFKKYPLLENNIKEGLSIVGIILE